MAPGCFSAVMACVIAIPVAITLWRNLPPDQGVPWPVMAADAFGFASGASILLMYRHRHHILSWTPRRQASFMGAVWGVHFLMLGLVLLALYIWY